MSPWDYFAAIVVSLLIATHSVFLLAIIGLIGQEAFGMSGFLVCVLLIVPGIFWLILPFIGERVRIQSLSGDQEFVADGRLNRESGRGEKAYVVALDYLIYENQAFWTRAAFILAALAVLLGFLGNAFKESSHLLCGCGCVVGVVLSGLGIRMGIKAQLWIERCEGTLRALEESMFGTFNLFRRSPRTGMKSLAMISLLVLGVAFIVLGGFSFAQLHGGKPN